MKHHCRCRKCETRRVLKQHPDAYIVQPACRVCGARDFRVDKWMMQRDTFAMGCNCGGYWWSFKSGAYHRRGSKGCWYDKDGQQREQEHWND